MYESFYYQFLSGAHSIQVFDRDRLVFVSGKDKLIPLLEYIDNLSPYHSQVVVFDKITGNAAALLLVKAGCTEIYSPLGSQLAISTLAKYGIKYHLTEIVPYILKPDEQKMCPMEALSIGKEPQEFYRAIKELIS